MVLSSSQLNELYGRPKSVPPVQVQQRLPWLPRLENGSVQVVLAHPLIADVFVDACHAAASSSSWVPRRIDSYYPRAIRNVRLPKGWKLGDPKTSRHSWGLAFDFFTTPYPVDPPGGVWTPHDRMPDAFARAFTDRGFTWGASFQRTDTPHIEYARAPQAGPLQDLGAGYVDFLSAMAKQGDVGPDVLDLQFMLRAAGETTVVPSGTFDSATDAAVRKIQTVVGLAADGLVGPKTERAISDLVFAKWQTAEGLVNGAYADAMPGRPVDPTGRAYWVAQIHGGLLIPDLWRELWNSPEAVQRRTAPEAPPAPPAPVAAPPAPGVSSGPESADPVDSRADAIQEIRAAALAIARAAERLS